LRTAIGLLRLNYLYLTIIIMFYYAIMAARHTVQYTYIQSYTQIGPLYPLKRNKKIKNSKTVKRDITDETRATLGLLYCAA